MATPSRRMCSAQTGWTGARSDSPPATLHFPECDRRLANSGGGGSLVVYKRLVSSIARKVYNRDLDPYALMRPPR
jgi:hypothetical protein